MVTLRRNATIYASTRTEQDRAMWNAGGGGGGGERELRQRYELQLPMEMSQLFQSAN